MAGNDKLAALGGTGDDLRIVDLIAHAVSYPLPEDASVVLGIGRAVKRDAVIVKVTTAGSPGSTVHSDG